MSLKNGNFQFGDFLLDQDERVLMRGGIPVQLPPKALNLLFVLVENRGHIVNKDDLMQRVWPDSFVEEGNLSYTIQQLRKSLEDDAHDPRFIETVQRRGYRFVAEVSETFDEQTQNQVNGYHIGEQIIGNGNGHVSQPRPSGEFLKQPQKFRYIFFTGVIAILVLGGLAFYSWQKADVADNKIPFQNAEITKLSNGKALHTAVSPDGKQVAYILEEKEGQSLWLRRTGVEGNVQIVPPGEVDFFNVSFGRDGDLIYYVTSDPRTFDGKLYAVPVLGGPPRKLLENVSGPIALSHDGTQVAFIRARAESEGTIRLMVASVDGTNERQVYAESESNGLSMGMPPAWSPDDSRIASLKTNTREILNKFIAVNLRDSTVEDLTPNEWKSVNGTEWTTDGLLVSARHRDEDNFQLWQIDPKNKTARKLTNDLNGYGGVSLSRDGYTLATIRDVTLTQLWSVPIASPRNFRQITSGSSNYIDVSFTPQGKLLYSARTKGVGDIWQMDADDRDRRELTKNVGSNYGPTASPDGRIIFFHSNRDRTYFIYRSLADGSEARKLTDGNEEESEADCSPDGKTVVFLNYLQGSQPLKRVSAEGGTPVLLNDRWNGSPAISPDGKLVAVWHAERLADEWQLALIRLQTGGKPIKTFPVPAGSTGRIRWTADGRGLLYNVMRDGVSNIWRQPIGGSEPVPVTQFQNDLIFSFDVAPDGKTLVCERGTSAQDVILLSDK